MQGCASRCPPAGSTPKPATSQYDLTGPAGRDAGAISFEAGPFQASDTLDCGGIGTGPPSAEGIVEQLVADERLVTSEPRSVSIAGT